MQTCPFFSPDYFSENSLDNAFKGVNMRIANVLGLTDVKPLDEQPDGNGAGVIGRFPKSMTEKQLLSLVKEKFGVTCIRHNSELGRPIRRMAVCGGAGAFLIEKAVEQGADAFMTGEIGYHRFFGYDGTIKLIEAGHFESEQFTVDLISDILKESFPKLRVLKTANKTNPINYFI